MSEVAAKPGVETTPGMIAYLSLLQAKIPDVPLTVTSGVRGFEAQAAAMLGKLKKKGEGELRKVYRQNLPVIEKLLKTERSTSAWAEVLRSSGANISRHMGGGAIDLRTKDLSSAQLAKVRSAVAATGGRAYVEFDHLHIDLPKSFVGAAVQRSTKTWAVATVLGAVAVGILIWRKRREAVDVGR